MTITLKFDYSITEGIKYPVLLVRHGINEYNPINIIFVHFSYNPSNLLIGEKKLRLGVIGIIRLV